MSKRNSKSSFGEMILLGLGVYGLIKILGDNEPTVGQAILPHYDPTTGRESEEAKKKRIQRTIEAAKAYGIDTFGWSEGGTGEDKKMDCLNFVYNVLRDAGYRDESGKEIPRSRTNNMHKQTAFFDIVDMYVPYTQKQSLDLINISKRIQIGDIVVFTQFMVKDAKDKITAQFPNDYKYGAGHVVIIKSGNAFNGFRTYEMPSGYGPKSYSLGITVDGFNGWIRDENDVIHVHVLRPNKKLIKGYYLNEKKITPQYLHGQIV